MTVKKDGNSWYYRVYIGTDPQTHKKQYKKKRGFRTQKEAKSAEAKLITEINQGTYIDNDSMTVKEFMEYFKNQYILKNCSPSTVKRYGYSINDINEYLGKVKLLKLNPLLVQQFYDDVVEDKEQSQSTLLKTHRTFHLALQCALKWRLVNHNVCDLVVKPKAQKKAIEFWQSNTVNLYLKELEGAFLYNITYAAIHTGLRVGELCALRWTDIDLDNKTLSVNKNRSRDKNGVLVDGPTKNKKTRVIALFDNTIQFLKSIKPVENKKVVSISKTKTNNNDYVFQYIEGGPIDPHYVSQKFTELLREKPNIHNKITFHGTRHTHATMLMEAGVNIKVISERLGHSGIQITLDTYAHVTQDLHRSEMLKASTLF